MRCRLLLFPIVTILFAVAAPASAQNQALVEKGMKLYVEQKCSVCHSVAGKGNPKGALDNIGATLSADEIRQWLTNPQQMREKMHAERKPAMKSSATLSKEDIEALVAYVQTLKKK